MKKNLKKENEVIKNDESKLYIFYNITRDQGIKRLRPIKPSNIKLGEIVKISGEYYILLSYSENNKHYELKNIPDFNLIKNQIELGTFNPSSIEL